MRGTTPTLHCDAEDGDCGSWDVDYYAATVSKVNDVVITDTERAPGWVSDRMNDYCSEHATAGGQP